MEALDARPATRSCSPPRRGATPACDPLLLTGVLFGKLGAEPEPTAFYRELEPAPAFVAPRRVGRPRAGAASTRCSSPAATRPACGSTSAATRCSSSPSRSSRPTSRRRDLPRRPGRGARASARTATSVLHGRTHDVPAEVHGARRVPRDVLAARPLLPDLPRLRRRRGARGARAARGLRARPARAVEARHARRRLAARSSSRTAATSRRAGRATRT